MSRSKEIFLTTLDIYSQEHLVMNDILLVRHNENCPFGLLTERNGHVILSVGDCIASKTAMVVEVPNYN